MKNFLSGLWFVGLSIGLLAPTIGYSEGIVSDARVSGVYCTVQAGKEFCSVYFNKLSANNPPLCATNFKLRMQINAATSSGKAMLAVALAANAQNKIVFAQGSGGCGIWPDTEDLQLLMLAPKCAETNNTWGCTNL